MLFNPQDWLLGLIGGLLIGTASAIFLLGMGRIAGISGIAGSILRAASNTRGQDAMFLVGLILVPAVLATLRFHPEIGITQNPFLLVAGGLIVGVGTRLGNGCTSGHGVCGMTRFSLRSFVSVGVFMAVAGVVASLVTPIMGV